MAVNDNVPCNPDKQKEEVLYSKFILFLFLHKDILNLDILPIFVLQCDETSHERKQSFVDGQIQRDAIAFTWWWERKKE